ncbi:Uncharacterized protein Rs2_35674 [Raphanus sativus]|nr:Uncharacterized protein Rs2_35674 [Raphanus sativus]
MARTRSSRRKEKEEDSADSVVENVKELLPKRLFATDRFPSERTNIYSMADFLLRVRDALKGTPEMLVLLSSCFGGLFKIPARGLYAGRVVHNLMSRQVVTKKKYEMWHVFAGKPFRFSLVEFGEVTGFPCGEFEDGYTIEYQLPETDENYRDRERHAWVEEAEALSFSDCGRCVDCDVAEAETLVKAFPEAGRS